MSTPKQELGLVIEFRNLYSYVSELGLQFNLVHKRLENLETQLKEISTKFDKYIAVTKSEIAEIQEKMFTKTEFDKFISELQFKMEEALPPLPQSLSIKIVSTEEPSQQM